MPKISTGAPAFLRELLEARSPTGHEHEAQKVVDRHLKSAADSYEKDALGNRIARLNLKGNPTLLLAGHMDELGLIIKYIDPDGFLYFDTLGGHDRIMIPGRRVQILTAKGTVYGVTGKRAVHLMDEEDRKKIPQIHQMWIDIGVRSRDEAAKRVSIGDSVVYDHGFQVLSGTVATARAFDDKAGCYVVCEVLRRLVKLKNRLNAQIVSVATTQEEIGTRGVIPSAFSVNPHLGIAVDVGHATDHPDCDLKKHGQFRLGAGPILAKGPNINPWIFETLKATAERLKIPYQVEAEPRPTGTDARAIQMTRAGVATGLISIPLRYMHTPGEVVDLEDIENAVRLLVGFSLGLKKGQYGHW
jgi:putative aminopeptidase FrvX